MKNELRAELLRKRDSIPSSKRFQKETAIKKNLFGLDVFKNAKSILMYVSFRSEVDTITHLDDILELGKKLVVPLVDSKQKSLTLYEIRSDSELEPGYMGIPEPRVGEERIVTLKDIDLVVIPGTGFDTEGNRLGYGGGYYDRLLSKSEKHVPIVALSFEEQMTDKIPAESHDIKMDIIITAERIMHCSP